MSKRENLKPAAAAGKTIGLPRALLYHRFGVLWQAFFENLGCRVVVSPPTNRELLKTGDQVTVDEACLSTKIYMGHVKALIGKCDYILVPWISNYGRLRVYCTKFTSLYDMVANTFRSTGQSFIAYSVDEIYGKTNEKKGFVQMAGELGFSAKTAERAYKQAKRTEQEDWKEKVRTEEAKWRQPGLKILIAAHSYVAQDAWIGAPVKDYLTKMGAVPILADRVNRKEALKQSARFSPTMKWELNREIAGSLCMNKNRADGIVLLSAFPCGPDAMTNEMIIRRVHDIPILQMTLDGQDGTAGQETRLESFLDILNFKKEAAPCSAK